MKCRTAYLIVSPRMGESLGKLADMIAVFSAAGWKTDTALRESGRHARRLAKEAAASGYDLVIGYGGDGTLNQVVNGVMAAKRSRSIVAVLPGGTANVWVHEIGMLEDPVKASLLLIDSAARRVDLGRVQVAPFPQRKERLATGGRHHFLLMAGLGLDAAILRRVSTALKEKVGAAAVALAAAEALPTQHAFPMEIWSSGDGREMDVLWRGAALQVIVGNTRRYGNIAEVTPDARLDDGVLDLCVITAGDPLTTIEQIFSILLRRDPGRGRSQYFRGARFWIRVPASVGLQLDGSRVQLADDSSAPDRAGPGRARAPEAVMVTYRFDAVPRAMRLAIPNAYDGALFAQGPGRSRAAAAERRRPARDAVRAEAPGLVGTHDLGAEQIDALLAQGRKVTVAGVGPDPERQGTWVVAGRTSEEQARESKPVAVCIDHDTTLVGSTGESLPASFAAELREGSVLAVEGRRSKRGVIRARRVVVVT